MSTNKNTAKNKAIKFSNILIALLILGGLAAVCIHFITKPTEDFLQGQAEATEVHVASKIVGRFEQQLVKEGDQVKKGQLIAVLSSPELDAKLQQAQSAKDAASAQFQKANNGSRSEQVQAAYDLWQQAKAAAVFFYHWRILNTFKKSL